MTVLQKEKFYTNNNVIKVFFSLILLNNMDLSSFAILQINTCTCNVMILCVYLCVCVMCVYVCVSVLYVYMCVLKYKSKSWNL